ncbi:hypothetical protein HMPREF9278_0303 [Mobiluncus mulieris FB024-16]|nr:hypothetical protein HMPREF9278_0303 [Mobiluncus mulieris FB024-16]
MVTLEKYLVNARKDSLSSWSDRGYPRKIPRQRLNKGILLLLAGLLIKSGESDTR